MNDRELAKLAHGTALHAQLVDVGIANALAAIKARLDDLDGYPATASGADTGPRGSSDTSSTERVTLARLGDLKRPGVVQLRDDLEERLLIACTAVREALAIMDRFTGAAPLTPAERHRLRCIGTGDAEGAGCGQWAVIDGRCIDCNRTIKAERERKRYHQNNSSVTA